MPLPKRSDSRGADITSESPRLSGSFLASLLLSEQITMLFFSTPICCFHIFRF